MLTNTYEYLAIILRSLRLVANCIRKPIRHIFATIWRIWRDFFFLHSQGYSPQCETSIMLLSHCGEYPCECKKKYSRQIRQKVANIRRMGLRMQFATNRNDRKMITRHS